MGFGTYLYTDIYFSRETYNSKYKVEQALEEAREKLRSAKGRLTKLAFMTEPNKFCVNEESPDTYLDNELRYAFEEFEEAVIADCKLNLLLDYWDETHNSEGKAIRPSDEDRKPFICGDFVE